MSNGMDMIIYLITGLIKRHEYIKNKSIFP